MSSSCIFSKKFCSRDEKIIRSRENVKSNDDTAVWPERSLKGAQATICKLLKINLKHVAMYGMKSFEASNILTLKVLF